MDVNGDTQHPLFELLKSHCPSPVSKFRPREKLFYTPQDNSDIRWNFEKILVDRNGTPLRRYEPGFLPADITSDIEAIITGEGCLRLIISHLTRTPSGFIASPST
ncbi:hypothetical protein HPB51_028022 [Rhipicephalus microplus]|uniref:glutathione peroxidase n=1 Tax=Rhipicephalus microplus TaxID=6941 RepID=A0A9J6CYJ5_RHIMP|nr:glutathione peroxidase 3-like [Rhipicephalus microplus]KAH7957994.1 hypothetical protein HPB51_028022 [Rhipicephalus microplus]